MKVCSNIHTHTTWSDGADTVETVIRAAIEKGFHTIGISDHGYTAFDESYCMQRGSEKAYKEELQQLRERYAGQIDVLTGIEYEYAGEDPVPEVEYVVGSLHCLKIGSNYYSVDEDPASFPALLAAPEASWSWPNGTMTEWWRLRCVSGLMSLAILTF